MGKKSSKRKWRCRCCGELHPDLPMHYGAAAPVLWFLIPELEREQLQEIAELVMHNQQDK
ncbi:hypothetical protein FRUB_08979 [Fimbriiglobus ruber]|uniref:Uncharacterized protein n=1 Tax=Fimbriiglobus ruber TaxID=1908690 RepID=A0A225DGD1_9BACT|nr:hypothetical protein FRUB_08979 [Fimbriiglobus ruber]